ncbi:MAG: T9SS type A sorting domain-containing protein [Bacteroidetes bacterium]|nr:T9SS type A sorting domain-containing protein [Bacteroidota bacterium]
MKNKLSITLFSIIIMLILVSATNNVTSPCDSPIVGDHSGAPGETTCSGCHSAPVNPNVPDLRFEFENGSTQYQLDSSYIVHIRIRRNGHDKFGFVCSALDSTNTSAGTFSLINTTSTRTYTLGGRKYVSHTPCGADSQDSAIWTYRWKAPSTNKGKIKIYMSVLVANHDEALTGDTTYTRVLQINNSTISGIKNQTINSYQTKVFPTIFSNSYTIEFNPIFNNRLKSVSLFDINGKIIQKNMTKESDYKQEVEKNLDAGVYFLKIEYPDRTENIKIIKQ